MEDWIVPPVAIYLSIGIFSVPVESMRTKRRNSDSKAAASEGPPPTEFGLSGFAASLADFRLAILRPEIAP